MDREKAAVELNISIPFASSLQLPRPLLLDPQLMSCSNPPEADLIVEGDAPEKLMEREFLLCFPPHSLPSVDELTKSLFYTSFTISSPSAGKPKLDSSICARCKEEKGVLAVRHSSYCR